MASVDWKKAVREGVVTGSVASLASTAVLMAAGRREAGTASAPVNAISHWAWEDEALHRNRTDLHHTVLGYAIHHAAAVMWATLYAAARQATRTSGPHGVGGAALTSTAAAVVDFRLTPRRLRPGFEQRLSKAALVSVYAAFALGLVVGGRALGHVRRRA